MAGDTLALRIEHDPGGTEGGAYAYATVPGAASAASVAALAAGPGALAAGVGIGGLVNRRALQAGAQGSAQQLVLQAVFWEAGEYALAEGAVPGGWGGARIAVDAPAIVVLRCARGGSSGGNASAVLAVAVPDRLGAVVGVTAGPAGCAPVAVAVNPVEVPDAMGRSVVLALSCPPAGGCCVAAEAGAAA